MCTVGACVYAVCHPGFILLRVIFSCDSNFRVTNIYRTIRNAANFQGTLKDFLSLVNTAWKEDPSNCIAASQLQTLRKCRQLRRHPFRIIYTFALASLVSRRVSQYGINAFGPTTCEGKNTNPQSCPCRTGWLFGHPAGHHTPERSGELQHLQ